MRGFPDVNEFDIPKSGYDHHELTEICVSTLFTEEVPFLASYWVSRSLET